ncbi:MAG: AAA-like domain-containing protein [Candidatus Aminicenantes bacterium]|nr:AAA-like domain-containing protein [Candidatus Aminicenantes bacterium]
MTATDVTSKPLNEVTALLVGSGGAEPSFEFDHENSLKFVFEYDLLPKSVMPRFIAGMDKDIYKKLQRRTSVVLADKGLSSSAVIKVDERDKKVYIYVDGDQKRDYLAIIRKTFRDIHDSFENLEVKELIPLPGSEETVDYYELLGYERAGRDEYFSGKLEKTFSISKLLNGIEDPGRRGFGRWKRLLSKKDLLPGAEKRRFSSYGPINTKLHYYVPRDDLINSAYRNLTGSRREGGHYITVWAPRQTGKTWVMQELVEIIEQDPTPYSVGIFSMERGKKVKNTKTILEIFTGKLSEVFQVKFPTIKEFRQIPSLFTKDYFQEPVILIIDEFDALQEEFINDFAAVFRDMFISRSNEKNKASREKTCLLHGLALVGVRSVVGIENTRGSPFNVQRSVHIPNLTYDEVKEMFSRYEEDSRRKIEAEVIEKLFYETNGQPGLTCWFGELLSEGFEGYTVDASKPVTKRDFEIVYAAATYALPNNNILNLISKAKQEPEKNMVLKMFQTDEKIEFRFDNKAMNSLYMNGIADREVVEYTHHYLKFSCPFAQKRLFNYFSDELFNEMGTLVEPFAKIDHVITPRDMNIRELMKLYETYLGKNKSWLFKDAPRRSDLKIYEAVYHFNLFAYLKEFLRSKGGNVLPEFPTGNGQIDLFIKYKDKVYGLELKSFTDRAGYKADLEQAAGYGKKLGLAEIFLVIFVESIDDENRRTYGKDYKDAAGVTVKPIFICTGVL